MKKCPMCAEEVQDEAIKCKHCGSDFKPQKKPAGCLQKGCLVMFAFALIGALFSPDKPHHSAPETSPPPKGAKRPVDTSAVRIGNIVTVNTDASPVAIDDEAWDALFEAVAAKDDVGVRNLMLAGKVFVLNKGQSVKVIDQGFESVKIRVVDGPHAEKAGWILTKLVGR